MHRHIRHVKDPTPRVRFARVACGGRTPSTRQKRSEDLSVADCGLFKKFNFSGQNDRVIWFQRRGILSLHRIPMIALLL